MTQLVLAPRTMASAPLLQSRASGVGVGAPARLVAEGEPVGFEQRPVRMAGSPLTGAHAIELYRRTQWLPTDVLAPRLDLRA